MKVSTSALTLALAATGLAAPSPALEKRVVGSITLFSDTNQDGTSYTIDFNVEPNQGQGCVAPTLPSNIDGQASSVTLSATGPGAGFYCQLFANQNCQGSQGVDATRPFYENIPDLSNPDFNLDNRARSVYCYPNA